MLADQEENHVVEVQCPHCDEKYNVAINVKIKKTDDEIEIEES